jgi:hypothetical protein
MDFFEPVVPQSAPPSLPVAKASVRPRGRGRTHRGGPARKRKSASAGAGAGSMGRFRKRQAAAGRKRVDGYVDVSIKAMLREYAAKRKMTEREALEGIVTEHLRGTVA